MNQKKPINLKIKYFFEYRKFMFAHLSIELNVFDFYLGTKWYPIGKVFA